jgi:hypothetical protein
MKTTFAMKMKSQVGCWNVKAFWETGKTREVKV